VILGLVAIAEAAESLQYSSTNGTANSSIQSRINTRKRPRKQNTSDVGGFGWVSASHEKDIDSPPLSPISRHSHRDDLCADNGVEKIKTSDNVEGVDGSTNKRKNNTNGKNTKKMAKPHDDNRQRGREDVNLAASSSNRESNANENNKDIVVNSTVNSNKFVNKSKTVNISNNNAISKIKKSDIMKGYLGGSDDGEVSSSDSATERWISKYCRANDNGVPSIAIDRGTINDVKNISSPEVFILNDI
jgi:hypothetical protein